MPDKVPENKSADAADFLDKVRAVVKNQGRYSIDAYLFVFEALEFTIKRIGQRRHVTGQELLKGIRDFALLNFGAMGRTVFNQWGVRETKDFGRIVFALVEAGLMSKTDADSLDDFASGFDFAETFEAKYTPADISAPSKLRKSKPSK